MCDLGASNEQMDLKIGIYTKTEWESAMHRENLMTKMAGKRWSKPDGGHQQRSTMVNRHAAAVING